MKNFLKEYWNVLLIVGLFGLWMIGVALLCVDISKGV